MHLKRNITSLVLILVVFATCFLSCKDEKQAIKQTEVTFTKEGEITIFKASDSTKVTLDIEIGIFQKTMLLFLKLTSAQYVLRFIFNAFYLLNTP